MRSKTINAGQLVRTKRRSKKLTQMDLAHACEFNSAQHISNLERGVSNLGDGVLRTMINDLQLFTVNDYLRAMNKDERVRLEEEGIF